MALRTGLVSVTFRQLSPREIVDLVKEAGLDGIEWGGDIHVPHGDLASAREVARMTQDGGIEVAAYGSYYRAASLASPAFEDVLATAYELGAPTIRVWAGERGSKDADEAYRAQVADDLRRIAALSEPEGISISLEYHGGTLTDGLQSAGELLDAVHHPNLFTYWQPEVTRSSEECRWELAHFLPWLTNVHVFQWSRLDGETIRHPLEDGAADWQAYFDLAQGGSYALLEFVRGDDPEQFRTDAQVLQRLLGR